MQERLDVKLLVPGRNAPAYERHIIAHVNYLGEEFVYKFGRNQPITHVWSQIPRLVMDSAFEKEIKERGAALCLGRARNRQELTA
jgi:hypothetical protein